MTFQHLNPPGLRLDSQVGAAPGNVLPSAQLASSSTRAPQPRFIYDAAEDIVEAMHQGVLGMPEHPLSWPGWVSWRSSTRARPEGRRPVSAEESRLWQATMSGLFGEGWRTMAVHAAVPAPASRVATLVDRAA